MTTQFNLQQVAEQAMYSVAAVSVMSVAMGIMVAAMGPELLKLPPEERKGTKKALDDLRIAFGADVVNGAVENVGYDDILILCREVEKLYIEKMRKLYGEYATNAALKSAPPGDVKTANEIAMALSRRGYGKFTDPKSIPAHITYLSAQEGTSKAKRKAKSQRDTKTGAMYKSKSAAGMAVAAEYRLDPTETFIWYEVVKLDPNRFVSVTPIQYEAYLKSL